MQLASGQAEQALTSWQKAQKAYRSVGDRAGVTWTVLNSTQALQALGFYRRALDALNSAQQSLQSTPDSPIKAAALRSLISLGNTARMQQDKTAAWEFYKQAASSSGFHATQAKLNQLSL